MFYKKYILYNKGIEIIVPSDMRERKSYLPTQYQWVSSEKKTAVCVTRGGMMQKELISRLNEFYKAFSRDCAHFMCLHIMKRQINGRFYGEIQYCSSMMGYRFMNIFLLGTYQERELLVTIQSMDSQFSGMMHDFENVLDSLKVMEDRQV